MSVYQLFTCGRCELDFNIVGGVRIQHRSRMRSLDTLVVSSCFLSDRNCYLFPNFLSYAILFFWRGSPVICYDCIDLTLRM